MLRQLVNYAPHKATAARLKYDTHLDFYVADSAIDCHRDHLDVDGYHVKVLTMKEPPAKTFAHMLQDLYTRAEHVHRLSRVAAAAERHDAARPARPPAALLQQDASR